jgi:dihydrofolate synthase/folylpolyglutamate synthase
VTSALLPARQQAVLERLYGLAPRGAQLGLERVRAASASFGHPDRRFSSLHVAGTNGKGSISAMTAAMALAGGVRVGLYTSPHLCRFAERIQIDGRPVADDALIPALEEVLDRCPELTFFETATVAAFQLFARFAVDLAVVEVGLGGRLDATNVLESPRATAIASISFDHVDRLGSTLTSIAREKAGIAKPGVPLFVGPLAREALAEVEAIALGVGAPVKRTDRDPELASFVEQHPPALEGAHQRDNARIAVALGREAGLSDRAIAEGLARVEWRGRLETIRTPSGDFLLDAAHNADGAAALAAALRARRVAPSHVALVFGSMADKDYPAMLEALAPLASHRVYVAPEGRRAADPGAMTSIASGDVATSPEHALELGRKAVGAAGLVVVTGSIFLVGAVRARLLGLPRDPAIAL